MPEVEDDQIGLRLPSEAAPEAESPEPILSKKDGNNGPSYAVVHSLAEFYPHPYAAPVELAGRIRDLHYFKTSSGDVGFFMLHDANASVRVFAPADRIIQEGEPLGEGDHVRVRGAVKKRDGKKVCEAIEVTAVEGGAIDGETAANEPTE